MRRLRWGAKGHGKRGGLRVIYYRARRQEVFYMLFVFPKNRQEGLTPAQIKVVRRLVREEFG